MRLLIVLISGLVMATASAGVCKGDDPCKACANCRECRYCKSGKGSCSVAREQADRDYLARQKAKAAPKP